MNDQTPINPLSQEWLAAYADGALDPVMRRRVAHWLSEHPEAIAELEAQEDLSPGNREYWNAVAPPLPEGAEWDRVLANVVNAIMPAVRQPAERRSFPVVARALALVAAAAVLFVAVLAFDSQRAGKRPNNPELPVEAAQWPLNHENDGDDLVFSVATADDVELIQLPEAAARYVVVGRHPMADVPLLLASASDVQLLNYGPDEHGNLPDIETTLGPDASMLWAPSPRP